MIILIQRRRVFVLGALVLVGVIVVSSGVVRTQADHEQAFGVNTRELVWSDIYDAFQESPLTGYGFGAVADHEFSPEVQRWVGSSPQTHSSWLDALYEQGLLGIVPWVVALVFGLVVASRSGPIWAATLAAGLVSATFESWMFAIGGGIGSLFWLMFGAAALAADDVGSISSTDDGDGSDPEVSNVEEVVSNETEGSRRFVFNVELPSMRSQSSRNS